MIATSSAKARCCALLRLPVAGVVGVALYCFIFIFTSFYSLSFNTVLFTSFSLTSFTRYRQLANPDLSNGQCFKTNRPCLTHKNFDSVRVKLLRNMQGLSDNSRKNGGSTENSNYLATGAPFATDQAACLLESSR